MEMEVIYNGNGTVNIAMSDPSGPPYTIIDCYSIQRTRNARIMLKSSSIFRACVPGRGGIPIRRCSNYVFPQFGWSQEKRPNVATWPSLAPARSWLFATKSKKGLEKANSLGTDVVILDLEDSVPLERKDEARQVYRSALEEGVFSNSRVYVRVNEIKNFAEMERDVQMLTHPGVEGFLLSKTESSSSVLTLGDMISKAENHCNIKQRSMKIIPVLETARAYFHLKEIASSPRIAYVLAGDKDLMADLVCDIHSPTIDTFFSKVVLAAKAANIEAFGGAHDLLDDVVGFEKYCKKLKKYGFTGAIALTPKQVAIANQVFSYSPQEIEWAKNVLDVKSSGQIRTIQRSIQESRQMIGPPHCMKAVAMLKRNQQILDSTPKPSEETPKLPVSKSQKWVTPELHVGKIISSPLEVTVTESWKTLWDSAFFSTGGLANSSVMSSSLGLPGVPMPFSLVATLGAAFTVSVFSHDARVHLGFYDMFQNRPVFPGDTIHVKYCVDSSHDKVAGDGNLYTIANSSHWVINQHDQVVFTTQKRTMFAPRKVYPSEHHPTYRKLRAEDSAWRKMITEQPTENLTSLTPQPLLVPGQVFVHDTVKVHSYSEMAMLASLMRIINPHHHNIIRYAHDDILVPGPFVMAAAMANASQSLGEVIYEDIPYSTNLNKVNPGDQIGTVTYVMDSRPIDEDSDLEQVTIRHLAIKNTDVDLLLETGIPEELVSGSLTKPSEYEAVCQRECPLLHHKIACQVVRRIIRVRPGIASLHQKKKERIPQELLL